VSPAVTRKPSHATLHDASVSQLFSSHMTWSSSSVPEVTHTSAEQLAHATKKFVQANKRAFWIPIKDARGHP
jgi:hypothetical protein